MVDYRQVATRFLVALGNCLLVPAHEIDTPEASEPHAARDIFVTGQNAQPGARIASHQPVDLGGTTRRLDVVLGG